MVHNEAREGVREMDGVRMPSANLAIRLPSNFGLWPKFLACLCKISEFSPQGLTNNLWACAALKMHGVELLDAARREIGLPVQLVERNAVGLSQPVSL